jgi:hypothetical protein
LPELFSLSIADDGLEVLNLNQTLAHENDLRHLGDSGDPGVAEQLGV